MEPEIRVILAGGGTGGHVFPAIYIARYLKENWGARCLFLGTKRGIESVKVPQAGFLLKYIWISGIHRRLDWRNLWFPIKLFVSLRQSRRELKQFRPHLVIGTGGYVCGPVLHQAVKMRIPTAIQEQNSYPGITTRLLAGKVDITFLAYEDALKYLKDVKQYKIVGNPVRRDLQNASAEEGRKFFGLKRGTPVILVFGGSQGSRNLNKAVDEFIESGQLTGVQLLWQTGTSHFDHYKYKYQNRFTEWLRILPFIDRMDLAYAVSEFAVCRAGAMTIAELAAAGLPAILVPLPHAAADHQLKNARSIAHIGAALIVEDQPGMTGMLNSAVQSLLNTPDLLETMSRKMTGLHHQNALDLMAGELRRLIDSPVPEPEYGGSDEK